MEISFFLPSRTKDGKAIPGTQPKGQMSISAYLDDVKNGRWEKEVYEYRAGKREKTSLPGVTPSGVFTYRSSGNLVSHSGILVLDFDKQDNEYFPADAIAADPYVYAFHRSAGGGGYAVYIKIDAQRHGEMYLALEKYFADTYQVIADPSGKDVGRFRFVSYDDELWRNEQSKIWKKALPKKQAAPVQTNVVHTSNDVEHTIQQLRLRGANIAESYHDWVRIGMGFAASYRENGRDYFHQVSSLSAKYDRDKCDKKFNQCLKSTQGKVTISTFFYLAKQAGIEIKTERTRHIERVATMRALNVGQNGGYRDKDEAKAATMRILTDVDKLQGEDLEAVVDQVMALPKEELIQEAQDGVAELKEFLRGYDMKFNEITGIVEVDGQNISDRVVNSIYVRALESLGGKKGKGGSKDLLIALIESDFVPAYNPIREFFMQHAHIRPTGLIDRLIGCMRIRDIKYSWDEGRYWTGQNYAGLYLRKWLLSCVASWHGTYSVMMVVLTGAQAAGKTNFFRKLLPQELSRFYADNKLDRGDKDDWLLMVTKALICDDEFSGKSKQDYKMLKELISKQTFNIRRPYGRFSEDLERIAVLCGCSNEDEVINDPTGNRRIIPIPLIEIDWEEYNAIDKTALWMELYHEWKRIGNDWMLTKDEVKVLNMLGTSATQVSTEEEAIWMFFGHTNEGGHVEWLTNTEIRNYIEVNSRLHINSTKLGLFLAKHEFPKRFAKENKSSKQVYGVIKKRFGNQGGGYSEPNYKDQDQEDKYKPLGF